MSRKVESDVATESSARRVASEIITQWPAGQPFHAREALKTSPELYRHKSAVLDLAYEEFCRTREQQPELTAEAFADRFPTIRKSLLRLLEVHEYLEHNADQFHLSASPDWPPPGSRFLDIDLVAEIGRGASSRVYLGRELRLANRNIVVKLTPQADQEANALGRLTHPNIVPVFSVQTDPESGLSAICMPYEGTATLVDLLDSISGGSRNAESSGRIFETVAQINSGSGQSPTNTSKARWPRSRPFVDGVVQIGIQLADALSYAHARGIFHGDIKPSNVLLREDGTAKLLDFNLSLSEDLQPRAAGGTLPYMAPEQLALFEGRRQLDARADLFSLGATLYELLSGKLPFGGISVRDVPAREAALALRVQQEKGVPPLDNRRTGHGRVAEVIEQCLAYDPEARPPSAAALAKMLRHTQRRLPRLTRWVRRHRRSCLAAACLVVLVLTGTTFHLLTRPSYADRQIQAGRIAAAAEDFGEALLHFNDALQSEPECLKALFLRGYTRLNAGEFHLAYEDLRSHAERTNDGRSWAALGHCAYLMTGDNAGAQMWFDKALQNGFESAELQNDIGYCYFKLSDFRRARFHFNKAARLDPALKIARFNSALLELHDSLRNDRRPNMKLIESAVNLGAPSMDCELDAACFYAYAAAKGAPTLDKALVHCRRALKRGASSKSLNRVASHFPDLRENPEFASLLKESPAAVEQPEASRVIDPLRDRAIYGEPPVRASR